MTMLLRRMRLKNFKAFEDFTLNVAGDAFLVGPNNTGKTTVLSAARLAASLLQTARSLAVPSVGYDVRSRSSDSTRSTSSSSGSSVLPMLPVLPRAQLAGLCIAW